MGGAPRASAPTRRRPPPSSSKSTRSATPLGATVARPPTFCVHTMCPPYGAGRTRHRPNSPTFNPPTAPPPHASPQEKIIPLSEALQLAIKVLTKTADATALTPENFDLVTLTRVGGKASPERNTQPCGASSESRSRGRGAPISPTYPTHRSPHGEVHAALRGGVAGAAGHRKGGVSLSRRLGNWVLHDWRRGVAGSAVARRHDVRNVAAALLAGTRVHVGAAGGECRGAGPICRMLRGSAGAAADIEAKEEIYVLGTPRGQTEKLSAPRSAPPKKKSDNTTNTIVPG
eukprot:scaffold6335_cov93-Isochrysis_galbana.AAC.1